MPTLFSLANYLLAPVSTDPTAQIQCQHAHTDHCDDIDMALSLLPFINQSGAAASCCVREFNTPVQAARYEYMTLNHSTLTQYDLSSCPSRKYVHAVIDIINDIFMKQNAPKLKVHTKLLAVGGTALETFYIRDNKAISPEPETKDGQSYMTGCFLAPGAIPRRNHRSNLEALLRDDSIVGKATRIIVNRMALLGNAWGIVSDERQTFVFYSEVKTDRDRMSLEFEPRTTEKIPLRYLIAATLFDSMQVRKRSAFDTVSHPPMPLVQGAYPPYPTLPHCPKWRSEFDKYTMQRNLDYWQAFLTWQKSVTIKASERLLSASQTLQIRPNHFSERGLYASSPYPMLPLPSTTLECVTSNRRPRDTTVDALLDANTSLSFTVTEVVRAGWKQWSQVVFGRLGNHSQPVCFKIFDERLFPFPEIVSHIQAIHPQRRFMDVVSSEDLIREEIAIYNRMHQFQGTILPHFYGAHLVTLPDGWQAYGILLEVIDGPNLGELCRREQSEDTQISTEHKHLIIKQAQHAVRALNYAAISQLDLHAGQILCPNDHQGNPRVVLIDFAMGHLFLGDEGGIYARADQSVLHDLFASMFGDDFVDDMWGPTHDWDFV